MNFSKYSLEEKVKFINYFTDHITPNKLKLFDQVIQQRTRHITAVVENIYAEQNATAILRTTECLGIQDLFVIEEYNKFKIPKKIASGAAKWVDIHRYNKENNSPEEIVKDLKSRGYKIVCTSPNSFETTPFTIDLKEKLAIFFGEEEPGLSQDMMQLADIHLNIPMYGFTESLNVSVSAGIVLNTLIHRLKESETVWQLDENEKIDLKLTWMCNAIKGGKEMLSRLL